MLDIYIDRNSRTPPFQQIVDQIKGLIVEQTLRENDPLPSVRLFSENIGVSQATTQRSYNQLRAEGFVYTKAGAGCFVSHFDKSISKKIVVFIPTMIVSLYLEMLDGIYEVANSHGLEVQVCNYSRGDIKHVPKMEMDSHHSILHISTQRIFDLLNKAKIEGNPVIYIAEPNEQIKTVCRTFPKNLPFVSIDWVLEDRISVISDYGYSGKQVVEYLAKERQAKKILVLVGKQKYFNVRERLKGIKQGAKAYNLKTNTNIFYKTSAYTAKSGYEVTKEFLKQEQIDAVFCSNDYEAVGAYGALTEQGYSVGKDVAVVGYGAFSNRFLFYVELTTVQQFPFAFGRSAVEAILAKMENGEVQQKIIETKFIVRET